MSKTMVVFGGATRAGAWVARHYGRQGYDIVLVGRQAAPLAELAAELSGRGVYCRTFIGDLGIPEHAAALVKAISSTVTAIDAIYYGPEPARYAVPTSQLTLECMQDWMDLLFFSLHAVIGQVLPAMRVRKSGTILVGLGEKASLVSSAMGGPAPAMAAAQNYLQSLEVELGTEGVHVGVLDLTAPFEQDIYLQLCSHSLIAAQTCH